MSFIVAIDGPAGTGKGTMAEMLSKKYNLVNIDTGATYRCVALEMLNKKIGLDEEEKIAEMLKNIKFPETIKEHDENEEEIIQF